MSGVTIVSGGQMNQSETSSGEHEHVVRGDMGADGTHLASSLPPGTDPLSKNEKIFPHPLPRDYPHLFS